MWEVDRRHRCCLNTLLSPHTPHQGGDGKAAPAPVTVGSVGQAWNPDPSPHRAATWMPEDVNAPHTQRTGGSCSDRMPAVLPGSCPELGPPVADMAPGSWGHWHAGFISALPSRKGASRCEPPGQVCDTEAHVQVTPPRS